jgi:SAM-dependent methyltransferase
MTRKIHSGMLVCRICLSRYEIEEGIPNLLVGELVDDWVLAEQTWWDRRYTKIGRDIDDIKLKRGIAGLRSFERARYLFVPLKQRGMRDTSLLEVGAGTAKYVAHLLPPRAEGFLYIGTDIAREALLIGAQLVPEGDFVQCEAGRMPFRKESFDTLLCLGVLHHLPCWRRSLERIVELLKPGEWMLLDEAIEKPRLFKGFLKKSLGTIVDSPHGGDIPSGELAAILRRKGRLVAWRKKTTTLRVLLTWLLGPFLERSLFLTQLVVWSDELFLRSMGRIVQRLGPAEALGIFEKRRTD